jgi:hypothetical protein
MDFKFLVLREFADFGMDRNKSKGPRKPLELGVAGPNKGEFPIDNKPVDSQIIIDELAMHQIANKEPFRKLSGIQWGNGETGTLDVSISPLGSSKATVRRKIIDLEGNHMWICKKIFPIKLEESKNIAIDLVDELEKLSKDMIEMPNREYKKLETLSLNLANKIRRFAPQVFMYEGINKINARNYIIYMSLCGAGVEAPGARRVNQFNINISFSPETGLIRIFGNDISSKSKGFIWSAMPSEWNEYFSPAQKSEEIEEAIMNALSTY